MSQRTPILGGNWKMNTDLASGVELAGEIVAGCAEMQRHCDVAVFPPFPYLQAVGRSLGHSGVLLGAQDVFHEPNGAFTGEVSAEMLVDLHVAIVLCGHSERRHVIGESDELVNHKVRAALDVACTPYSFDTRSLHVERASLEQPLSAGAAVKMTAVCSAQGCSAIWRRRRPTC